MPNNSAGKVPFIVAGYNFRLKNLQRRPNWNANQIIRKEDVSKFFTGYSIKQNTASIDDMRSEDIEILKTESDKLQNILKQLEN